MQILVRGRSVVRLKNMNQANLLLQYKATSARKVNQKHASTHSWWIIL